MLVRSRCFVALALWTLTVGCSGVAPDGPRGSGVIISTYDAATDARADLAPSPDVAREAGTTDVPVTMDAAVDMVSADQGVVDVVQPDVPWVDGAAWVDGGPAADNVAYTGTLPIQNEGARFMTSLSVLGHSRNVWVRLPRVFARNAPLMIGFHGTNADGEVILEESGAAAVSDTSGVVFLAPNSRWFNEMGADFDHPGGNGTYWETANNPNPGTNEDLVLVRALIQEARRSYGIDPTRVYVYGHSNGAFMAYTVAQVLNDRVAAFGENSGGLSRCDPQRSCRFQGDGTTCEALATQTGWCNCTGRELPVLMRIPGRRTPGILFHGTHDDLVSVYHSCMLAQRMRELGHPFQINLFNGGGHATPSNLAARVWTYVSAYSLAAP